MTNVTNIIWIERDVDNQSCKAYSQDLEKIKSSNMKLFKTIEEAIVYLKEIRFEETKVIIGGKFFEGFVKKFRENIKDINVAPKIIVLTPNREKFLEFNQNFDEENDIIYNNRNNEEKISYRKINFNSENNGGYNKRYNEEDDKIEFYNENILKFNDIDEINNNKD